MSIDESHGIRGKRVSGIFFIADTHFGDDNIRRYENRTFQTVRFMDEEMIVRWNHIVTEEDIVYVLGDFGAAGSEKELLERLNGDKLLVKGNHDLCTNGYYRAAGFEEVYDKPVILDNFWILSHEPMYVNANMPYANIFGHVHNSPLYKDFSAQHYCVSAERIDYTPISFDKVASLIKGV